MDVEKFQDIEGLADLKFCEELNTKLERLSESLVEERNSFKEGLVESPKSFHMDSDEDSMSAVSTPKKNRRHLVIQSDSEDEEKVTETSDFDIKEYGSQDDLEKSLNECSQKSRKKHSQSSTRSSSKSSIKEGSLEQDMVEQSTSSWVQCDRTDCQKWRRVDNVDDMISLADGRWVCSMNSDARRNNCEYSQESLPDEEEDESIYTSYKPGSLVLGKMAGYPWWPGIVEDDPDFDSFFHLAHKKDKTIVSYHITFLDKDVSRAWLADYAVRPFTGQEDLKDVGTVSFSGKNYARSVTKALFEAKKAMELTAEKRIRKYGFLRRFQRRRKSNSSEGRKTSVEVLSDSLMESVENVLTKDIKDEKIHSQPEHPVLTEPKKDLPSLSKNEVKLKNDTAAENSSNLAKPTARQIRETKLEKKKKKLEKLEAERQKLKKSKKATVESSMKCSNKDKIKTKDGNGKDNFVESKKIARDDLREVETACSKSVDNTHHSSKEDDVQHKKQIATIKEEKNVLGSELTENEIHAEKMLNKYISKEQLEAVLDTTEEIIAKKLKFEEAKKLKEEKAEQRKKSKKLKVEERQRAKELKAIAKQKSKEKRSKSGEKQKSKESKSNDKQKSKQLTVERKKVSKGSTIEEKENLKESKAEIKKGEGNSEAVTDCMTTNANVIQKQGKDDIEYQKPPEDDGSKPTDKQSLSKMDQGEKTALEGKVEKWLNVKVETNEKATEENSKSTKDSKHSASKKEEQPTKTKEPSKKSKKEKVPMLIKPDIPNVDIDEIIANKINKLLPGLVKPVFKAPKKKKSSNFQAPTKNKSSGGKRPLSSPRAELEIDNNEPPMKKPNVQDDMEVNIGSLLNDSKPTANTTQVLNDSPEF